MIVRRIIFFFMVIFIFMGIFSFASSNRVFLNIGISDIKVAFDTTTQITLGSTTIFSKQIENITDEILGQYKNYFKVINRGDITSLLKAWKMRQMGLVESTQTVYQLKPVDVQMVIDILGAQNDLYFTYKFLRLDGTEAFPTKTFSINNVSTLNGALNNIYVKINAMLKSIISQIHMKVISVNDNKVKIYTYGKSINVGDVLKVFKIDKILGEEEVGKIKVDEIISNTVVEGSILSFKKEIEPGDICVSSKKIMLKITTDKSYYDIGDTITINVSSNSDCYIYIFDVRKNGKNVSLLFPIELYPPLRDNFISKDGTLSLPYYKASEPVGEDQITVFGSRLKLKPRSDFDNDMEYYQYVSQTVKNENGSKGSVKIKIGN